MPRTLRYIILFIAVVLLQVLLFDNLDMGLYVRPMVYLAFLVLLPIELAPVWVLLSAFLLGVTIDVSTGAAAINSCAILFSAFARPLLLRLGIGKEDMREGSGTPTMHQMGVGGFLKYASMISLLHCFIFFSLEAATWSYFYLTALRIIVSAAATTVVVFTIHLFFVNR